MADKNKYGKTYSAAYEDVTAYRLDLEDGPDAYTLILPETLDWSADRTDQIVDRFDLIAEEIARQIKGVGRRLEDAIKQQEEPNDQEV